MKYEIIVVGGGHAGCEAANAAAKQAYKSLIDAENGVEIGSPIDMIEIDLKECFDLLGEIIGITYSDEIIDNLFRNFCVGK